jgi:chromosome segregation protein
MQLKAIAARILDKYQITIDQIEIEENIVDDLELMGQIDTLKTEIEGMGAVNLVAIEEYEEHKQREDFLVTQREDLERSLESVNQAIQKINRTSRETFLGAFEQIRANFQEVFEELFGGGETELRLIDESDVLESGIDIIACPPGKRPQSITQLSGGERSLVAIALLFAVFKIKPSPFCVLDEVDAALDEANVLRFTNLIRKYAQQTQFIIITHNKRTMEIADVMYGVTMEQAGLSKVVSAKFGNQIAA